MNTKTLLCFLLCSVFFACIPSKTLIDNDALLARVKVLSSDAFEGRKSGTEGAKKARSYIINHLKKLNVKPLTPSFKQEFNFLYETKKYAGTNILGIINGTDKPDTYIVISAHYDHLGVQNNSIYNGADDNASGVSALLAFAEYFKENPPAHSIILAAFDAEELGFEGSKYFVEHTIISQDKIVFNINMDMVSRSNDSELFIVGANTHKLLTPLLNTAILTSKKIKLTVGHDGSDGLEDWTSASDHASFYRKQIPFLYFGVADHNDYHKSSDDFENIHPEFYKEALHQIILMFNIVDKINF
jgi:Zn-dependent M28 family amino/carboxypeptidase